ncbi:prenyltransferase and squalene oxidase repeat-containing protein [Cystoisospora suis]|uniref:Geranylgeranyl transferase type II subunit beta n=1 Tax=Cystoisospora suis TaxID=483139 RepID=A0A2C6KZK5_9APIC|nr:prenyltransferase and squalene oxidase repeat-containing protein [Cystoisospora suis]
MQTVGTDKLVQGNLLLGSEMDRLLLLRQENARYLLTAKHRRYLGRVLMEGLDVFKKHENSERDVVHHAVGGELSSCISQHDPEGLLHDGIRVSADVETYLLSGIYWTLAAIFLLQGVDEHVNRPVCLAELPLHSGEKEQLLQILKCCKRTQLCEQHSLNLQGHPPSGCWTGFAPHPAAFYDATVLSTLSALQILVLVGDLESEMLSPGSIAEIRRFVQLLQDPETGAFANRISVAGTAEVDVRFAMCSVTSLALLEELNARASCVRQPLLSSGAVAAEVPTSVSSPLPGLHSSRNCADTRRGASSVWDAPISGAVSSLIDAEKLAAWIFSCQNPDGGFGCAPGCESHAGTTFCAVACLQLLGLLGEISLSAKGALQRWLTGRQVRGSGMNGRPGKDPDSCYTWWVLATASILGVDIHSMFDTAALEKFVLTCQNEEGGGISRAPGKPQREPSPSATGLLRGTGQAIVESEHEEDSQAYKPQTAGCLALLGKGRLEAHSECKRVPDPFHTFFGLAGLSVLLHADELQYTRERLANDAPVRRAVKPVNPLFGLPADMVHSSVL